MDEPAEKEADPTHRIKITMIRMDPGAELPEHRHPGAEELFVLRGECLCQGRRLGPGDYHRAGAGTQHEPTTTETGCEMILITRPVM